MAQKWTEEEKQFLINNKLKLKFNQMAQALDRTETAVRSQWCKLLRDDPELKKLDSKAVWNDELDEFIINNLANMYNEQLAEKLEMTVPSVASRIQELKRVNPDLKKIERPRRKPGTFTRKSKGKRRPRRETKEVPTLTECPSCNSERFNKLDAGSYFCMSCLKEYSRYGNYMQPIK